MTTSIFICRARMSALVCLFVVLGCLWIPTAQANPSNKVASAALDVHATIPAAKESVGRLYALVNELAALREQVRDIEDKPETFPIRELMQLYGKLNVGRLEAQQLIEMGEPAGRDLYRRFARYEIAYKSFCVRHGRTPRGQKLVIKQDIIARKLLTRFPKIATKAMQLATAGNFDGSQAMLLGPANELYRNMAPLKVPYDKPFGVQFLTPLNAVMAKISAVRAPKYRAQGFERIASLIQSTSPFGAKADAVIADFSTGIAGAADAAAFSQASTDELLKQWATASTTLVRANAIAHSFQFDRSPGSDSGPIAAIADASKQLQDTATAAYVRLIDAAAMNADPDSVSTVYGQLLSGVSKAQRRSANGTAFLEACKPSLAKLSGKSASMMAQLASYQRATTQPLQWRERFAKKSSEPLISQFPGASSVLATQIEKQPAAPPYLHDWASLVMAKAGPSLVGKLVSGKSARRLLMSQPFVAVPSGGDHYLNVAVSQPTQDAVEDLKASILVSDSHLPLSFTAAEAVSSATSHDYEGIGGKIVGVTLEPRAVRFAALPLAGYALVPFGSMPSMHDQQYDALDAVCWRIDVQSAWVHHKYFVVTAE